MSIKKQNDGKQRIIEYRRYKRSAQCSLLTWDYVTIALPSFTRRINAGCVSVKAVTKKATRFGVGGGLSVIGIASRPALATKYAPCGH